MKSQLSTDLEKVYTKFVVDESVINWLKSKTGLIIDVTQKAIQENRFEVVKSALGDLAGIAKEYIQARIDYASGQDQFLIFLDERLIDMKNMARIDTHPEIMLAIAKTAKEISIATLDVRPTRTMFGENYMPLGFINILRDICLSQEILKETSYAPMTTINFLVDIGTVAVDKGFPNTANLIIDRLGEISKVTIKLHFLFADEVSGKANWGLARMLDYVLSNLEKINTNRESLLKQIVEEINSSIKTYLEDDERYQYTLRSNIKPFFGPLSVEQHGIASVFVKALQQTRKDDNDYWPVLKALEDFLTDLNQNAMSGMNSRKYLDIKEMLEHVYMIGIAFTGFINRIKEKQIKDFATKILETRFLYPFTNAITMSFKHDDKYDIFYDDYIDSFFSLIGITFFENKNGIFSGILGKWLTSILEITQEQKKNIYITHEGKKFVRYEIRNPLTDLYKHLGLAGIWFLKYLPKSKTFKSLVNELGKQPGETIARDTFGVEKLYPQSLMEEFWRLKIPYLPYDEKYFSEMSWELYDQKYIDKFERLLKRK